MSIIEKFTTGAIFEYNRASKRAFIMIVSISVILLALFITFYFTKLKSLDYPMISMLNSFFSHIITNINSGTFLGTFYAGLFGGLFFVILPMEALFLKFLKSGFNPYLIVVVYVSGFLVSYTINYYIGQKLANLSRKIITPKKFYKIKGTLNRHGGLAVFGFNLLPLPSQPLSAILGVFRYDLRRFYLYSMTGQLLKYLIIALGFIYFGWL